MTCSGLNTPLRFGLFFSGSTAKHGLTETWPCLSAALNALDKIATSKFTVAGANPSDCR